MILREFKGFSIRMSVILTFVWGSTILKRLGAFSGVEEILPVVLWMIQQSRQAPGVSPPFMSRGNPTLLLVSTRYICWEDSSGLESLIRLPR